MALNFGSGVRRRRASEVAQGPFRLNLERESHASENCPRLGIWMRRPKTSDPFRVVAIISAYNEADIISPVIEHLVEQGVEVYLIDNRSTDATVEGARAWLGRGLLKIEEFPEKPPRAKKPPPFDWGAILKRKEELAGELRADWFIHHDADEFREAPWPGMTLKDAIRWVDRLGYNCIDFRVLNFPPVDDGFRPGADPRKHFKQWEEPIVHDTVQLKCWKNTGAPVSLAASGGHEARFRGRRVFPIQFLLRHYPIRSQEHGRRKVFEERKNRFLQKERAKGWHVQYDQIEDESHSFLGNPQSLHPYDEDQIRFELILHNRAARIREKRARVLRHALEAREQELAALRSHNDELEHHAANLQTVRAELERHAGNLEGGRAELERHAKALEKERERLDRLLGSTESGRAELERHAKNLEKARDGLTRDVAELQKVVADRKKHAANLETSQAAAESFAKKVAEERNALARRVAELQEAVRDRGQHGANLESARKEIERYVSSLQSFLAQRDRELANLESARAESERYAKSLEGARKELELRAARAEGRSAELERSVLRETRLAGERKEQADRLDERVRELSELSRELESRLADASERVRELDFARSDLERRNHSLAAELEAIQDSTTWRWSAPLRRLMDLLRAAAR